MFADDDATRTERRLEHRKRTPRLRASAHEDVEGRVAAFGPGVHADMAFGENGNAGDAAAFREPVQMNVQKRRARRCYGILQRLFDPIAIVEMLGVP